LWSLLEPDRLSRTVRRSIAAKETELWLSPISIWEFLMLAEKGRLSLHLDAGEWLAEAWRLAPLREAPLTREIVLETLRVELAHGDPADRFLVATARVHELTLVTADRRLIDAKGVRVLASR
jgi:PIN domain nuclease of toxin-antitoxin system